MIGQSGVMIIPIGKETTLILQLCLGCRRSWGVERYIKKDKNLGWNDVLRKAQKAPGSTENIINGTKKENRATNRCRTNYQANEEKKPLNTHYLTEVNPLTEHQTQLFDSYAQGKHLIAYGVAGTGKHLLPSITHLKMY